MSLAFIFPGQGSQQVGMGKALAEAFPESRAVFQEADAVLGFSLSDLCWNGPEADLQLTANTQPAILTASVAAYQALEARGITWVDTPRCGAATWRSDAPDVLRCERMAARRYWHHPDRPPTAAAGPELAILPTGEKQP